VLRDRKAKHEHRFWVAEIFDLHQTIAVFFGDGETVMGRELDANDRFGSRIIVFPILDAISALARCEKFIGKLRQLGDSLIPSKPFLSLASCPRLSLEVTHVLEQPMPQFPPRLGPFLGWMLQHLF
jgi:hypothetical protein